MLLTHLHIPTHRGCQEPDAALPQEGRDLALTALHALGLDVELQAAPRCEAVVLAGFQLQRTTGAKGVGALAMAVRGLLQRQLATRIDADPSLATVEVAGFIPGIACGLDVHPLRPGIAAHLRRAGGLLSLMQLARAIGAYIHIFAGSGVDTQVDLGLHALLAAVVGIDQKITTPIIVNSNAPPLNTQICRLLVLPSRRNVDTKNKTRSDKFNTAARRAVL